MRLTSARKPTGTDALVCAPDTPTWDALPKPIRTALQDALKRQPVASVPTLGLISHPLVCTAKTWTGDAVAQRRLGGSLARQLQNQGVKQVSVVVPDGLLVDRFLTGFRQGVYRWDRYKAKQQSRLKQARIIGVGRSVCTAVNELGPQLDRCRDLINTPTADLGPADFVAEARRAVRGTGLKLTVLDEAACGKRKMGCLLAVGRAAARDRRPRMLIIDWPGTAKGKRLALCGKGVCFDTGGLQVKPGGSMELMRKDMGGAATVLTAMLTIAAQGGRRPVRAYLPLVENAIDGSAFRPGDVLTALDGTTVEVGHTDAEGRLILADAIALAKRDGADRIVTVATLTGAAMVALGRIHVPLMGTDDALQSAIEDAAGATGEKVWRLPLDDDHHAKVQGKVAQITNSAGPEASCITAGAFLAHFAGDVAFAHLDISPCCWATAEHALGPVGATGTMVETLARLGAG